MVVEDVGNDENLGPHIVMKRRSLQVTFYSAVRFGDIGQGPK